LKKKEADPAPKKPRGSFKRMKHQKKKTRGTVMKEAMIETSKKFGTRRKRNFEVGRECPFTLKRRSRLYLAEKNREIRKIPLGESGGISKNGEKKEP